MARYRVELHEKGQGRTGRNRNDNSSVFTKGYRRAFYEKGVEKMEAKTLAVQVSEELFNRLKERVEKERNAKDAGVSLRKTDLIEIITQALDAADELEKQDEDEPELHVTQPEELELENEERLQEAESEEETE